MNTTGYTPGISFIIHAHNEEQTLEASIRSLFALTIIYEILLVLHRCTDASAAIAARLAAANPALRIFVYNATVARAGYETLVTDSNSTHSIPTYYNWCLQHRRYLWTAKWDADFIAPPALIQYINANTDQWSRPNEIVSLQAVSHTHSERHDYFSSCLSRYMKELLYEIPLFTIQPDTHVRHTPPPEKIFIEHRSNFSTLKPYWYEPPWFDQEDTPEAAVARARYIRLVAEIGPEPRGLARSGSPDALRIGYRILDAFLDYVDIY